MKPLDIRDIAIIDAFPTYEYQKKVLNVGCGEGRIDWWLTQLGYRVHATDIENHTKWPVNNFRNFGFWKSDIFDLSSFPTQSSPIVICINVLEHLKGYKLALVNLIALTGVRLVITVPHKRSFMCSEHVNFWADKASKEFKDIHEFVTFCQPYSTSISKIRTKPQDAGDTYNYLIVVDKRQNI